MSYAFFFWAVLILVCLFGHQYLAFGSKGRMLCAAILQWVGNLEWLIIFIFAGLVLECYFL